MGQSEIEKRIRQEGVTMFYKGTWSSSGFNGNRITFIKDIKRKFNLRARITEGRLYCFKDRIEKYPFLSVWDYDPEENVVSEIHELKIDKNSGRLLFPKELSLFRETITWIGLITHFEIYKAKDWEELQKGLLKYYRKELHEGRFSSVYR